MNRVIAVILGLVTTGLVVAQVRNPKDGLLFDHSRMHRIDILMDTADFSSMDRNRESNELYPATFIIHYHNKSDTLTNVGIRPKGNFSRGYPKISFKISFNGFEKGRKYKGVEKLNLSAYMTDPTHLKAHLSAEMFRAAGLAAPRSAFANVFLNGQAKGVYNVCEHIDEEFVKSRFGSKKGNLYKCLSHANLTYLGNDVSKYDLKTGKRPTYELKTNKEEYDFSRLIKLTDILTNTPDDELEDKLEEILNVEDVIKTLAVDVLIGAWDGVAFHCNNFHLYDNPKTGKFELLRYDFDHTFGSDIIDIDMANQDIYDWPNRQVFLTNPDTIPGMSKEEIDKFIGFQNMFRTDDRRPIYYKLLAIDNYRNQYNYYLNDLIQTVFNIDSLEPEIDKLFAMLEPEIEKEEVFFIDYEGAKTLVDSALDISIPIGPYNMVPFPYGIKQYITARTSSVLASLEPFEPIKTETQIVLKDVPGNAIIKVVLEGSKPEKLNLLVSSGTMEFVKYEMDDAEGDNTFTLKRIED